MTSAVNRIKFSICYDTHDESGSTTKRTNLFSTCKGTIEKNRTQIHKKITAFDWQKAGGQAECRVQANTEHIIGWQQCSSQQAGGGGGGEARPCSNSNCSPFLSKQ